MNNAITYWPADVRLKMVERSEFYATPKIYQYGYYDGFQHAFRLLTSKSEKMKRILEAVYEEAQYSGSANIPRHGYTHKAIKDALGF